MSQLRKWMIPLQMLWLVAEWHVTSRRYTADRCYPGGDYNFFFVAYDRSLAFVDILVVVLSLCLLLCVHATIMINKVLICLVHCILVDCGAVMIELCTKRVTC